MPLGESSSWLLPALHQVVVGFTHLLLQNGTSLIAQTVKNPPAVQESRVQSLGQEDLLEEGMATCSSIFAWNIPWTEETFSLTYLLWGRGVLGGLTELSGGQTSHGHLSPDGPIRVV